MGKLAKGTHHCSVYLTKSELQSLKKLTGMRSLSEAVRFSLRWLINKYRKDTWLDDILAEKILKLSKELGKEPYEVISSAIDFYSKQFK